MNRRTLGALVFAAAVLLGIGIPFAIGTGPHRSGATPSAATRTASITWTGGDLLRAPVAGVDRAFSGTVDGVTVTGDATGHPAVTVRPGSTGVPTPGELTLTGRSSGGTFDVTARFESDPGTAVAFVELTGTWDGSDVVGTVNLAVHRGATDHPFTLTVGRTQVTGVLHLSASGPTTAVRAAYTEAPA